MEAQSEYNTTTHCIHYAQLVLINKVSASELIQKFVKSALLVGYAASVTDA